MSKLPFALAFFGLVSSSYSAANQGCSPQPLPEAADSVPPLERARVITFAATPMLAVPGRAWVARIWPDGTNGVLEIMRLRRQSDCNRYDIEARWQAPLGAAEYGTLTQAAAAMGTPPEDTFSNADANRGEADLVLDGTMITLDLTVTGWAVRRELNHFGRNGALVSKLFRDLVLRHVPAAEAPSEDWR